MGVGLQPHHPVQVHHELVLGNRRLELVLANEHLELVLGNGHIKLVLGNDETKERASA